MSPYPSRLIRSTYRLVGAYNSTRDGTFAGFPSAINPNARGRGYLIRCFCFSSLLILRLHNSLPSDHSQNPGMLCFHINASFHRELRLQHLCQRQVLKHSIAPLSPSACLCSHVGAWGAKQPSSTERVFIFPQLQERGDPLYHQLPSLSVQENKKHGKDGNPKTQEVRERLGNYGANIVLVAGSPSPGNHSPLAFVRRCGAVRTEL